MSSVSIIAILYHSGHLVSSLVKDCNTFFTQFELILVNNSPDDPVTCTDPNVKIINADSNLGYGKAINLGIRHAKHSNLLILNPDLIIKKFGFSFPEPDTLFIASGLNESFPFITSYPGVFTNVLRLTIRRMWPHKSTKKWWDYRQKNIASITGKTSVDWVLGSMFITNKHTMQYLDGFDEQFFLFYEEIDLCKRAKEAGAEVYIDPSVKYEHNMIDGATGMDVSEIKTISEIRSFKRYHSKYSGKINLCLSLGFIQLFSVFMILIFDFILLFGKKDGISRKRRIFRYYLKALNA